MWAKLLWEQMPRRLRDTDSKSLVSRNTFFAARSVWAVESRDMEVLRQPGARGYTIYYRRYTIEGLLNISIPPAGVSDSLRPYLRRSPVGNE